MKQMFDEKLNEYFLSKKKLTYKKGEIILRPGDMVSKLYYVHSGFIRLYKVTKSGKEITINLFKPLFVLSYYLASFEIENEYYFETVTDVELASTSHSDFLEFVYKNPEVSQGLILYTLNIVGKLLGNIEGSLHPDAESRIAAIICALAEKHGKPSGTALKINFNTTHRIISSLSGVSRETASIQIKRLEKKGVIEQNKGKLIINDLDKLKNIVS